jgi:hypothetical protein
VIIEKDTEDAEHNLRKLVEEYKKLALQLNFGKTEYLTLDLGAGIVTEKDKSKPSTNANTWYPFWKPPVQLR